MASRIKVMQPGLLWKRYLNSEYLRNISTVSGATTIAQAIPVIAIPILARIYTPEDYGFLALFVSITGLVATFANLKYSQAIPLSDTEDEAKELLFSCIAASLLIGGLFSAFFLIVIVFFLKAQTGGLILCWLVFGPLYIFFSGANESLCLYANKKKKV